MVILALGIGQYAHPQQSIRLVISALRVGNLVRFPGGIRHRQVPRDPWLDIGHAGVADRDQG